METKQENVREVILCKDCKYSYKGAGGSGGYSYEEYKKYGAPLNCTVHSSRDVTKIIHVTEYSFCSFGERRGEKYDCY